MSDQLPQPTLVSLFCCRAAVDGSKIGLHVKREGRFVGVTWEQLALDVRRAAAALVRCGIRPGDRVVQVSENRYEWIVVDLAVHLARGVHVAVHATLSGPQIAYQIADSGARLAIISTAAQGAKLAECGARLPAELDFFSYEPVDVQIAGRPVQHCRVLLDGISDEAGRQVEREALDQVTPDKLATILYTSGTTGEPKGVMLSHGNLASNAVGSLAVFECSAEDLRLCWLPLSHIFARTADLYTWLASDVRIALAEKRDTIIADCAQIKPTQMNGVPYFFDKICRYLHEQGKADEPGSLQQLLGGRMQKCCSGGAPLTDAVAEFFARHGVLLVQGYGLTETSPVITAGSRAANRIGTVGQAIPGVEVKIADDGEILTRGPHVMLGYWKKPEETAQTIRDGWLHTGDIGVLEDGFLRITGRKKELIVTAGGKNVAPTYLEGLLTEDPLIAQAMIVGDAKNYLAALIVPAWSALQGEIARSQLPLASVAEAVEHPEVCRLYEQRIQARLAAVSHCEQVAKFALVDRPFSIENGELTPTLKLRRSVIAANFADTIRRMYAS